MKRALATVLVAILGCSASAGEPSDGEQEQPQPPTARATWIEAAVVGHSSATLELTVPGEVEGSKEATLASAQGGYVEAANIEVGDEVKAGDLLFKIDTELYRAQLDQVRAELRAADREHKRAQRLGEVLAGSERDSAKDRWTNARASAKVAQIQAKRASVRAPFDGVIASVELEKGEVAGPGAPAARLLQLDPAKVTVSVPDRDVVGLRPGIEVQVYTDALAEPRTGTLTRINPAADIDTRAFIVEVEVSNEDRALLPGMIARVRVQQAVAEDRLVLPQNLLVTKRDANGVFVVEDEVARWRPLKLGAIVREQVVIEEGLDVGENIVVVGQRALAEGDPVIISRQGTCCVGGRPEFGS